MEANEVDTTGQVGIGPGRGARLLLVDDDRVSRTILARQLEQRGFTVQQAASGEQALALVRSGWPQALLIDYLMPELDGLAVVRRLRAEPATADMPIVLLTALDQPATIVDAFEQGVDDYVAKPVHPDEVTVRLLRLLRLAERQARLAQAAMGDALTGLLNRRGLDLTGEQLVRQAVQRGEELACLLFDLDHFKRVNDTHGHAAGDAVLVETARRLRACLRQTDSAGRYGGEEMAALLPGASGPAALAAAERVRQAIQQEPVVTPAGRVPVTISGGVALLSETWPATWAALLARADVALYRAKQQGRNRIERAEPRAAAAPAIGVGAGR
jgi:two-component system cell cycle response regulator